MQVSVHTISDTEGTALLDDGRLVPFDGSVVEASGLRHVRPGQRVSATLDEEAWRLTKMWVVGIGDDQVVR